MAHEMSDPEIVHGGMQREQNKQDFPYYRLSHLEDLDIELGCWEPNTPKWERFATGARYRCRHQGCDREDFSESNNFGEQLGEHGISRRLGDAEYSRTLPRAHTLDKNADCIRSTHSVDCYGQCMKKALRTAYSTGLAGIPYHNAQVLLSARLEDSAAYLGAKAEFDQ